MLRRANTAAATLPVLVAVEVVASRPADRVDEERVELWLVVVRCRARDGVLTRHDACL